MSVRRSNHSRGRALRTGVAWDMRTGFKTRGRRLISDGERPGVWTEKAWADQRHPQRFVRVPPPDGLNYRPGPPPPHSIGANVDLGWWMQSRNDGGVDGTLAQPNFAYYRQQLPNLSLWHADAQIIPIRPPTTVTNADGVLVWGAGAVIEWGGTGTEWS